MWNIFIFKEYKMNYHKLLKEDKGIELYKKLLKVLGEYSLKAPATGIDKLLDTAIEQGKKILPTDKNALDIIEYILSDSVPSAIQRLLNLRFSDLPIEVRPMTKAGKRHEVVWFTKGTLISDKVKDLIDFQATGKKGQWTNLAGEKVALLDLQKKEAK